MSEPEQANALASLTHELGTLSARVLALAERSRRQSEQILASHTTALRVLELIHDDDPGTRRRLAALRSDPEYARPFTASDPLVSVVIPTWTRTETLMERAIPSALAQTYDNIEVVVVGDASPPDVASAVEALGDPRVSFYNLTIRGPYDEEPWAAWHSYGTPGTNAGFALARGDWIAPLGDDDAFVPDHVERLLAAARRDWLEFVYGQIRMILPDGSESLIGEFPPRLTQVGLQAALIHCGLRFIELELGHALFHKPNDWGLVHRMMRTGVRMGMVNEVSVNYWPSRRNHAVKPDEPPALDQSHDLASGVVALEAQVSELRRRLSAEESRSSDLESYTADLTRRLDEVRRSRSWRLTAPLRRLRRPSR